jgi:hypothetical protein
MPRAPVPFFGCDGTPHLRGSFAELRCLGVGRQGAGKGKQTNNYHKNLYLQLQYWEHLVRRNPSLMVSVTWGIVRGGAVEKGGAALVLKFVPAGPGTPLYLDGARGGGMIGRRNVVAGLVATGRVWPGGEAGRTGSLTRE